MKKKKKDWLDSYECEGQLAFRNIDMEIKEDTEWEKEERSIKWKTQIAV